MRIGCWTGQDWAKLTVFVVVWFGSVICPESERLRAWLSENLPPSPGSVSFSSADRWTVQVQVSGLFLVAASVAQGVQELRTTLNM